MTTILVYETIKCTLLKEKKLFKEKNDMTKNYSELHKTLVNDNFIICNSVSQLLFEAPLLCYRIVWKHPWL